MKAVDAGRAAFYEGFPNRPTSIESPQHWTTGGLLPRAYCDKHIDEASALRVECLVEGESATALDVEVRFLQVVGGTDSTRQHALERRLVLPRKVFRDILLHPVAIRAVFDEPGGRRIEANVRSNVGPVTEGTFKVRVDVVNSTLLDELPPHRDAAMAFALAACHVVLHVEGGAFVSLFEPPQRLLDESRGCMNAGVWPVLIGSGGARDTMLASPIILYDHPRIGPEALGDVFDATGIDAILTLRILAMTDDEQREIAQADARARALLERTQGSS